MAEEYKGPSKILGAFGGWGIGSLVGGLAGGVIGLALAPVFGTGVVMMVSVIGLLTSIGGAVIGWNKAATGRQQYEFAQMQLATTAAQMGLAPAYEMTPQMGQSRFTDRIQPRTPQGSYADAVASEQLAANTQQTR